MGRLGIEIRGCRYIFLRVTSGRNPHTESSIRPRDIEPKDTKYESGASICTQNFTRSFIDQFIVPLATQMLRGRDAINSFRSKQIIKQMLEYNVIGKRTGHVSEPATSSGNNSILIYHITTRQNATNSQKRLLKIHSG